MTAQVFQCEKPEILIGRLGHLDREDVLLIARLHVNLDGALFFIEEAP